ncbi:MAG: thymidylate synthase [Nanoarchaeota archaeon]
MKKIKIGYDNYQGKDIFKLQYSPNEMPKRQLFSSEDVIVGNPSSNIAIGFIYTWDSDRPPEKIREFFQKVSNYAYITGLWKTTNGGRYVFSNILANPNVNKLLLFVFGAKDNGHLLVDALTNFWQKGVNKEGIIIDSTAPNPKFEQVPDDALERIRKQADLVVMQNLSEDNLEDAEEVVKALYQEPENAKPFEGVKFYSNVIENNLLYDDGARFFEAYTLDLTKQAKRANFVEKESKFSVAKSVHAQNLEDGLEIIAGFIFENGSFLKDQRGVTICESRSFTVSIENPLEVIPKGFSKNYIDKYVKEFMKGAGEEFAYTYHERLFRRWGNQVERAIEVLQNNPNTRRCMLSLWDAQNDLKSESPPCLDFIWVAIRDDKLEIHVVYRSHHLATITKDGKVMEGEGAFVPNMYALGTLQKYIADSLGVEKGPVVLTDFSGHLYVSEV